MTLDDVIRNIVYNEDIKNLLKHPDLTQPHGEITQFQINVCEENDTSIKEEGFQVGEPFDGDIENAPILFLSSNPAFNFEEVSPRYFAGSGKVFMPEHTDTRKKVNLPDGEYSLEEIKKMLTEPQKEFSFDAIKRFFKTRIQKSPVKNKYSPALGIPLKDGGLVSVPYWGTVRNNTEALLSNTGLQALWDGVKKLNPSQKAREIMKYVVCMEIVPFRSPMATGVNQALLNHCWDNFTKHLFEFSAAKVIAVVREEVFKTFCAKVPLTEAQKQKLLDHNFIKCSLGGKERLVVKAKTAGEGRGTALEPFSTYFDAAMLQELQNAVASSALVQKALANGGLLPDES